MWGPGGGVIKASLAFVHPPSPHPSSAESFDPRTSRRLAVYKPPEVEKLVVLPVLSESIAAQQHQKAQADRARGTYGDQKKENPYLINTFVGRGGGGFRFFSSFLSALG